MIIGNLTFNTQAEIDDFGATYGDCATAFGFVNIQGADSTNLDGMSSLEIVVSTYTIANNPLLARIDGATPHLSGQHVNVSISDVSGRLVYDANLDCQAGKIPVSVSQDLASGVYMGTLRHEGQTQTLRLVKE